MASRLRELADARAALFALELREEARRGTRLVGLAAAATMLLQLSLLMVAVLVVAIFWDTHRLAAIAGMALVYGACAVALLYRLRTRAAELGDAFPATRKELGQDIDRMQAAFVRAPSAVSRLRAGRLAIGVALALTGLARGARIAAWMRRGLVAANLSIALAGFFSACVRDRTDASAGGAHSGPSTGDLS